jgi:Mg2+ and Co2+ transporter CorA
MARSRRVEPFDDALVELRALIGVMRDDVAPRIDAMQRKQDELASRIDTVQRDVRDGFIDTQRRIDQLQVTLNEHRLRLSNLERAIVAVVPSLRLAS